MRHDDPVGADGPTPASPDLRDLQAQLSLAIRNAGGPSQREIARRTRGTLGASTISRMLNGDKPPRLVNLLTVLEALGVPEAHFTEWRRRWSRAANEPLGTAADIGSRIPPPSPLSPASVASICTACGCVVGDTARHRKWHGTVGRAAGEVTTRPGTVAVNPTAGSFPR
ncbi:hypothetical protein GCM10009557_91330 [Virgisporangium ochraceum]|uniref:HTH cro/C1-type domain-containing protein n=1 Tax=Virgisporangium ochraceum TaxID=65505 RepID=A0A8J4EHK4_9ACTN|nr:helix-turn-helix transcriptional regulator [Virgisporangium ochraceum]GIJ72297.1 hypothetical protein Voc01_072140 [Virgisporangium ochraceum]